MTPHPPHPSAGTRLIALLGDPVAHSLSPYFQNAAFRAAGVDGVYLALRCDAGSLPTLLRAIARAGGGGNITLPHKQAAAGVVDRRTEAVEHTGACNTFWLQEDEIWGDNTDVVGFTVAASGVLGGGLAGIRALLVGAGGAARAVLHALADGGAAEAVLLNRTRSRAEDLACDFAAEVPVRVAGHEEDLSGERFDLVVNATSLGLRADDPFPIRSDGRITYRAALDLVYRPGGTAWVEHLESKGLVAADGTEMLLHQGAAAFRRWWGKEAPIDVMRDVLTQPA